MLSLMLCLGIEDNRLRVEVLVLILAQCRSRKTKGDGVGEYVCIHNSFNVNGDILMHFNLNTFTIYSYCNALCNECEPQSF